MEYYTVGERLRRLEEACQVIKALFNEQRANFEGRYYRLENAPMEPKPIQDPLPLMIGGGGEKVTLRITARYADEWNVWGDVDRLRQKMGVLDGHCETVGRDPGAIQRSAAVLVLLRSLGGVWRLLAWGACLCPGWMRDFLYDQVARRRHRFAGPAACTRLSPHHLAE